MNSLACTKCGYPHAISAPCEKDPEPEQLNPRHIVFEGPDGSGKTTQIQKLETELRSRGIPCVTIQDPGTSAIGVAIRKLTKERLFEMTATEAAFAFHAGRVATMQHVRRLLDSGMWVLQDRYFMSTMVYQVLLPEMEMLEDTRFPTVREIQLLKSPMVADLLFTFNGLLPKPHLMFCMEGNPDRKAELRDEKLDKVFATKIERLNQCYIKAFHPILQNGGDVVRIQKGLNVEEASEAIVATIKARGYLY